MADSDKTELFERMPVPRALTVMAVPTVISQLINLIYNIVDTFFIGRTGNPLMVASVTVAFTLFMLTIAFGNLFGIGGGSLMARLMGQGENERARRVAAFSCWGAAAAALLYSLVLAFTLDPLLRLLGASDDTIGFAKQYVWLVVILGGLPCILSATGAHLLRNAGYSRQASLGLSGGGILNIALDPLFMFVLLPPGMEVFGAALATMLSNVVSFLYIMGTLARLSRTAPVSISPALIRGIRREDLKELFSVGVPSSLLTGLFDLANIVLNALMSAHGDLPLAAIGIVMKVERLPNAINVGICQGMLPIVAYNFAAGNRERMQQVIRTAKIAGLTISVTAILLLELFASPIIKLFLSTASDSAADALTTVSCATVFLRIRCLTSPSQFLNYHTSFCLQAMGDGRDTLIHAICRELVFYIPFMVVFDRLWGMYGLAAAFIAGETCGAVFALWLLRRHVRRSFVQSAAPGAASNKER